MGKPYNAAIIPDIGVALPSGRFVFQIESLDDSQETSNGKYQIKATLRVVEPAAFAGNPHYENFVIGTNDDPSADTPEAWKGFAAGRYRKLLERAGVELSGDTEQDAQAAAGQLVGGVIQMSVEPALDKNGQPNQYAGRTRSQVQSWFRPGEKEPGVDADANGSAPAASPAASTAAAPRANAQVAAPSAASKPTAKAPAAKQSLKCPVCSGMIERSAFGAHVESCTGAAAA